MTGGCSRRLSLQSDVCRSDWLLGDVRSCGVVSSWPDFRQRLGDLAHEWSVLVGGDARVCAELQGRDGLVARCGRLPRAGVLDFCLRWQRSRAYPGQETNRVDY